MRVGVIIINNTIKYEICCSFGILRVIWDDGSFKGNASDSGICQFGLTNKLNEREKIMADKAYRFAKLSCVVPSSTPWKWQTQDEKIFTTNLYRARQSVERLIKRVKNFNCISQRWRFSLELHQKCVQVVTKLVNLY